MPQNKPINKGFIFHATESYPAIKVQSINLTYAHLLSQNLFSPKGEMTAISQYLYQSWYVFDEETPYSYQDIFANIAKVEMRHMNSLGQLIYLLGLNPCFYTLKGKRPQPWNGTYLQYTTTVKEMLQINITAETQALQNYQKTIAQIDDIYVKAVLERICLDEQLHLNILQQMEKNC